MKAPKHTANYYRDWWLKKYHNITTADVVRLHPEEIKNPDWFKLYPCTQKQYEEWKVWAEGEVMKDCKITKYALRKSYWWSIELDCAPYIIHEK